MSASHLIVAAFIVRSEEGNVHEEILEAIRAETNFPQQSFRCVWAETFVQVWNVVLGHEKSLRWDERFWALVIVSFKMASTRKPKEEFPAAKRN